MVAAIGAKLCNIDLNIPGSTSPLQADSVVLFALNADPVVLFALNADPNRAGNPCPTEPTVPARVLG